MTNYIACLKHGTKYSPEYVNVIYNMVRRHCTIDYKFSEHKGVQNVRIPLPNNLYNSIDTIKQNKDKILNFIDSNLENNHILICCVDGIIISPFIVSLYLIKYGEIDKSEIKKIIQSKNQAVSMDFDLSLLDL